MVETVMMYVVGAFFVAVVAVEEAAGDRFVGADADLAVFPGGYGIAFAVHEDNIVKGTGFAHGTDADFSAAEVADDEGGFGLAEAFHDLKTRSVFELAEYFGVQRFAGSGHMLNGGEIVFGKIFLDQHSEHGGRRAEGGDVVFGEHGQDVGGVEAVEIIGENGAFGQPLAVELAPEGFAPAGIGNGEMETVSLHIVPVFGGDIVT